MSLLSLGFDFWKKPGLVIVAFISFSALSGAASVFEVLELSPEEVARAGSLPPASTLAYLLTSETERRQLIDALLEPTAAVAKDQRFCYAAQLLELWGELGRGLEILEREPAADVDRVHLMRLLYRNGKQDAAKEVFASIQSLALPIGPVTALPKHRIRLAVEPLILQEDLSEVARFLAWLQPQCRISEWRSAVLAQRLNLALHQGTLNELFAELAEKSTIARAIAERMLDPDSPMVTPDARTPVLDLAWLVQSDGCTAQAARFLEHAIQTGAGSAAERSELLRQFILKWNENEPRARLLARWMERDDEFIRLITGLGPVMSFSANLSFESLCRLAERHPDDAYLNFLAGFNQTSRLNQGRPLVVTRPALACLERAFVSSPLRVGGTGPAGNLNDISGGRYRYPSWKDDIALHALEQLAKRMTSRKLHELVFSRDDFKSLPVPDRLRYLNAAGLDLPFMDLIFNTNWRDPANDAYGGGISLPSSHPRQAPQELVERFYALMPEIILGSPQKPAAWVAAHSRMPFQILYGSHQRPSSPQELSLLRRWHAGLLARGGDFARQVLAEGEKFRGGKTDFEIMSEVLGTEAARRIVRARAETAELNNKLQACSWFAPSGPSGFPVGYGPDDYYNVGLVSGEDISPVMWLIQRYPALAGLHEAGLFGGAAAISPWAAILRSQLPANDKLAVAYDIAITEGIVVAPGPASAERAEDHVGAMLRSRNDPDFVLFRATRGISLKHGKPPADPAAIEELAKLRKAPAPIRRAAADLALKAGGERMKKLLVTLNSKGSPPPRGWAYPPGPSPDQLSNLSQAVRSLKLEPDLDRLCRLLTDLSETGQLGTHSVIQIPDVLARFSNPHHDRLIELLRLELEPIPSASGRDEVPLKPSVVDLHRLHAFFLQQSPDSAARFRQIAIERGWAGDDYSGEIAEVLLKDGQREAAIEWLANMVIQRRFPPPLSGGLHRFPTMPRHSPSDYLLDEYLPVAGLELIAREKLALPMLAIIDAMPGVEDPVLRGFLKFYDSPSIESFEQHLGGLTSPTNLHLSNTLRHRLPYLLSRLKHTEGLAKDLKETAPQ